MLSHVYESNKYLTCVYPFLNVSGKPRSVSSTKVKKLKVKHKTEDLRFDVMAFPVPTVSGIWFAELAISSNEPSYVPILDANASCQVDRKHHYISRCTLTIFSNISRTGIYKVQLVNDGGVENLTFSVSYGMFTYFSAI